jgi:septal ring-binding cell division protein DamX
MGMMLLGTLLFFQDSVNRWFLPPESEQTVWSTTPAVGTLSGLPDVIGSPTDAEAEDDKNIVAEMAAVAPMQWDAGLKSEQSNSTAGAIQPGFPEAGTAAPVSLNDAPESPGLPDPVVSEQADDQPLSEGQDEMVGAGMTDLSMQSVSTASMTRPEGSPPSNEYVAETPASAASLPPAPVNPPPASDPLDKTDWIRTRPANHYTLQLVGVVRLESLKDFVERHGLEDRAFYYPTRRRGKPWYPLLWGDFPDKKGAIMASEALPLEVQRQGYWLRQFRDLQAELDQN